MTTVRYAKPATLARLGAAGHVVIEASAGTGKTYTIEHLIVELLLTTDATIEQILVVTFTEKATEELRQRVRSKLAGLAALSGSTGAAGEPGWDLDDAARAKLRAAIRRFDLAPIHTIHGFCQRVLTENAFGHGRLFEQELVDGKRLFARSFRQTLRTVFAHREPHRRLLAWWLEQATVEDLERDLYRAVSLRAQIRGETDLERFAEDVDAAVGVLGDEVSFARLCRMLEGMKLERTNARNFAAKVARLGEIGGAIREHGGFFGRLSRPKSAKKLVKDIEEKLDTVDFGEAADEMEQIGKALALRHALPAVVLAAFRKAIYASFDREKREHGLYDYDDMLRLVAESLAGEAGPELAAELRRRYHFALIDEFQDTDDQQWSIFRHIFFESTGGHRLFVVGDPKQAIYSFRGADVFTYLEAREQIEARGGAALALDTNYRSTPDMVDAVNAILRPDAEPPLFSGDRIRYTEPVKCGHTALYLAAADGTPGVPIVVLEAMKTDGPPRPRIARAIAEEIRTLLTTDALLLGDGAAGRPQPIAPEEIFVLTRANAECREIGDALRAAGVPFAFYRQDGLFQTDEAFAILDLLRAIHQPDDPSCRLRAWIGPFFGAKLHHAERLGDLEEKDPFVARLRAWHEEAKRRGWERFFARVLDESGVLRRDLFRGGSQRALTNIAHIFEILLEETGRHRLGLDGLIRALDDWVHERAEPTGRDRAQQRLESERQAVQVMTVHKAKGLEAAVVFYHGGYWRGFGRNDLIKDYHVRERGRWVRVAAAGPLDEKAQAAWEQEQAEEEQRLLYVALTRARARLYLPLIGPGVVAEGARKPSGAQRPDGSYRHLNNRLAAWLEEASSARLATRQAVPAHQPRVQRGAGGGDGAVDPGGWTPPPGLLALPAPPHDFDTLRDEHAAFVLSSYSRMKRAKAGERAAAVELVDSELSAPREQESEPRVIADEPRERDLPGGAATGRFLHEVLEHVDFSRARDIDAQTFANDPAVKPLIEERARRHGIEQRFVPRAARMTHTALSARLDLGGVTLDGLCRLDPARVLKELEFLYPIPEDGHPRLGAAVPEHGLEIGRGYLRGFVDLVFEHEGRVWFADWKTDVLADYGTAALEAHVEEHYTIQKTVYAVALARWLGARDAADWERSFGGIFYAFLRGMTTAGSGAEGLYVSRPDWTEIEAEVEWLRRFSPYREVRHGR